MNSLDNTLFQLKFTAKSLTRQAKKAQKDEAAAKKKLKKVLLEGNTDIARIYASNAIRKKSEHLSLLRLASRVDAVAARVESAVAMRKVSGDMTRVVRGMASMEGMSPERISTVMESFESRFADVDVQTAYVESAISSTTATSTPQDQIDQLLRQVAEEANVELQQDLAAKDLSVSGVETDLMAGDRIGEEDAQLADRLRALRPAT